MDSSQWIVEQSCHDPGWDEDVETGINEYVEELVCRSISSLSEIVAYFAKLQERITDVMQQEDQDAHFCESNRVRHGNQGKGSQVMNQQHPKVSPLLLKKQDRKEMKDINRDSKSV